MRLAANLTLLYGHLPLEQQFSAAAGDGFRQVEILAPYDQPAQWVANQLHQHGLELVLLNTPVSLPDFPRGLAAQPDHQAAFQEAIHQAAEVCEATQCRAIHVMAGDLSSTHTRAEQHAALYENLTWAAQQFPQLTLHLEALNTTDVPQYLYGHASQVCQHLEAIQQPNVGMQFDFYHVAKEGQNIAQEITRCKSWIRHVQVAGAPNRHEPELEAYGVLEGFQQLAKVGYQGSIGLEYRPENPAASADLSWLQPLVDQGLVRF